jgi:hypothetical protein
MFSQVLVTDYTKIHGGLCGNHFQDCCAGAQGLTTCGSPQIPQALELFGTQRSAGTVNLIPEAMHMLWSGGIVLVGLSCNNMFLLSIVAES